MHVPERSAVVYPKLCVQTLPAQGVGEALRRGWRARSGESSFVLQTQSRREESEREAEAMEEAEKEARRAVEREKEVASTAYSFDRTRITRLRYTPMLRPRDLCTLDTSCPDTPRTSTSSLHTPHPNHQAFDGLRRSQAYDGLLCMGSEPSAIRNAAAAQSLRPALRPAQGHGPTLGPTLLEQQRASAASCATARNPTPLPAAAEAPIPYRPSPIAAPPSPQPPRAREAPSDPAAVGGLAQAGLETTGAASKGLADYDQVTAQC